ncbi:MAG: hypothetical protein FD174_4238 [Geobacteraceae bacterium]|nr:MAG: hypothetical protein FD174_4238 [Geobacteraceae bacterium]
MFAIQSNTSLHHRHCNVMPATSGYIRKCPHLIDRVVSVCAAADESYLPNLLHLAKYCNTKNHTRCLYYLLSLCMQNVNV